MKPIDVKISHVTVEVEVIIVNDLSVFPFILGLDFARDQQLVIDFQQSVVYFPHFILTVPLFNPHKRQFLVRVAKNTIVPPYSEAYVNVTVARRFDNAHCLLTPIAFKQCKDYAVAHSVNAIRRCGTVCRVMNFQPTPIVLTRRKVVATVSAVDPQNIHKFDLSSIDDDAAPENGVDALTLSEIW